MVEVVADVGGELFYIAAADHVLLGLARCLPRDLQCHLVDLYQRAFGAIGRIEEEIHIAVCVGLVGLKGRVDCGNLAEVPGLPYECERHLTVPRGLGLLDLSAQGARPKKNRDRP